MQKIYGDLFQVLGPRFEEWLRAQEEAAAILVERGWWPHPLWPGQAMYDVLSLKREKQLRRLDRLICDAYEVKRFKPMREAIRRWMNTPEFRERRRILADGLWAYRKRKYALAVCGWLPQVEGVLRAITERNGWGSESWKRTVNAITDEESFVMAFRSLFGDSSLTERRFPLRRNAILHGTYLRFGRQAHALRIFLMLDALHYFISEFERREERAA
jgi:hypothetical protein